MIPPPPEPTAEPASGVPLRLRNLTKRFDTGPAAADGIDLDVGAHECAFS